MIYCSIYFLSIDKLKDILVIVFINIFFIIVLWNSLNVILKGDLFGFIFVGLIVVSW